MDLDFLKEVGEAVKAGINNPEEMEQALMDRVKELKLDVDDLDIDYDKGTATVMGIAANEDTREKVLVAVGNTKGVQKVKDSMAVGMTAAEREEIKARTAERAKELMAKDTQAEAKARYDQAQRRIAFQREIAERRKAAEASKTVFYTVQKGDSLRKIAEKHYGDESKWQGIFEANQPMIKKADLIYPGQVLRIPHQG